MAVQLAELRRSGWPGEREGCWIAELDGAPVGAVTLRDLGVIAAGSLPAAKARLLLMLLLASGGDVRGRFEEAVEVLGGW
jgi:hypothetical protein